MQTSNKPLSDEYLQDFRERVTKHLQETVMNKSYTQLKKEQRIRKQTEKFLKNYKNRIS